jgi:hypothetical protein
MRRQCVAFDVALKNHCASLTQGHRLRASDELPGRLSGRGQRIQQVAPVALHARQLTPEGVHYH